MPVTHVNRKREAYFLHEGMTKAGKPKYFFSKDSAGELLTDNSLWNDGAFGAASTTGFR